MNQPNPAQQNPYAAPQAVVHDDDGFDAELWWDDVPLATRGSRLAAHIIDNILGVICAVAGLFAAVFFMEGSYDSADAAVPMMLASIGLFMSPLIGYNLFLLHKNGQTMGKKWQNIKIVRSDRSSRASLKRIVFLRILPMYLVLGIPLIGRLVQFADPLFIFSESRQCIHDVIADTIVVDDINAFAPASDNPTSW